MKPDEPIASNGNGESPEEIRARLLRDIESTRLPPDLREQIIKKLPPHEEMARMYRELQETGGVSFEEFFDSEGKPIRQP